MLDPTEAFEVEKVLKNHCQFSSFSKYFTGLRVVFKAVQAAL